MFETMLGLEPMWALIITTVVLLIYVVLGGAHDDILTDGVQGFMMLLVAILTILLFVFGVGVDGGISGIIKNIGEQDEDLVGLFNTSTPLFHSWWSIASVLLAHIPLGLLPHIGNKLWALKNDSDRYRFVKLAFGVGLTIGLLGLGGILARAVLGDELLMAGRTANEALPALYIELFPSWFAALIGVGILAAIMSTADGLVVSSSQILTNDIYRRSIAPAIYSHLSENEVDRRVLLISRWSTLAVLLMCMFMAWALQNKNIALLVWIGSGGMMAAFAGPLVMGALWRGVTKVGAYAGLVCDMVTFVMLHSGILGQFVGPESTYPLSGVIRWLAMEAPNPFSCAALGELVSVGATWGVSKLTQPLSKEYVASMFEPDAPDVTNK